MGGLMNLKLADNKGRVLLGKSYAGATMLAEDLEDRTIIVRPAVTVPVNEAWLWKNKQALEIVKQGLDDARQGRHTTAPDLKAAARLAAKIKD
jgi:hypothetical protein